MRKRTLKVQGVTSVFLEKTIRIRQLSYNGMEKDVIDLLPGIQSQAKMQPYRD